jgi:hypothetical protein
VSARGRRDNTQQRRFPWPWAITGGVIAAFAVMLALLSRQPRGPGVGDHWHARYAIELCGKTLPPLLPSSGDVHTHGDGIIHIHPASAASTGRRANLGTFFRTTQVRISETSITVPGETHANGERCPDGKVGTLKVLVQSKGQGPFSPVRDFLSYVPADRDVIRIVFGP